MIAAMSGSTSDKGPSYCSSSFLVPAGGDTRQKENKKQASMLIKLFVVGKPQDHAPELQSRQHSGMPQKA